MAPPPPLQSRSRSKRYCCSGSSAEDSDCMCLRLESGPLYKNVTPSWPDLFREMDETNPSFSGEDRLRCRPAAIDRQVASGDLSGIVAAEIERQRGDLLHGDELLGRLR